MSFRLDWVWLPLPLRYNNQTYRIDDIDWDHNPMSQFTSHTGESMSYVEYYRYVWLDVLSTVNPFTPKLKKYILQPFQE